MPLDLKTEMVDIDILISDPDNARKHGDKNTAAVINSLKQFGQVEPLVVRRQNNVVIGGNCRLAAMKTIGFKQVLTHYVDFDDQKSKALALALNRTGELAEWDDAVLSKTLESLKDDFDLGEIGFDEDDLSQWLKEPEIVPGCDEDEVPEAFETICKPGDLWILGEHRLLCGDSTNVQHVERLMGGEKADMVFTDPPYGISFSNDSLPKKDFKSVREGLKHNKYKPIEGDFSDFDPSFILLIFKDSRDIFIWGANNYPDKLPRSTWIVWDRKLNESADGNLAGDFDLCWSREKHKMAMCRVPWYGVFGHSKKDDGDKKTHPTMKPVKLAEWFFHRWGKPNDLVADLFLGSGSTLIACEKTNRRCFGLEIDEHYCDVIIARWEKYTGKKAVLAS